MKKKIYQDDIINRASNDITSEIKELRMCQSPKPRWDGKKLQCAFTCVIRHRKNWLKHHSFHRHLNLPLWVFSQFFSGWMEQVEAAITINICFCNMQQRKSLFTEKITLLKREFSSSFHHFLLHSFFSFSATRSNITLFIGGGGWEPGRHVNGIRRTSSKR